MRLADLIDVDVSWYFNNGKKAMKAKRRFFEEAEAESPMEEFAVDEFMAAEYVYVV